MPSKVLDFRTPLQALLGYTAVSAILMLPPCVFGCVAYVHLHKNQRTKLESCAPRYLFLGYAFHQKGYRCYDLTSGRMYITMDVTFVETETFSPPNSSLQGETRQKEQNWT